MRRLPIAAAVLAVVVLFVVALLVGSGGPGPGPPLGAVLGAADRRALAPAPILRGADPPAADPRVDLTDPTAVARAYLAAARSAVPDDTGRTRLRAAAYAAPQSPPGAVGLVVLDAPAPGRIRTAAVAELALAAATPDDGRRGYRAVVATATGPPGAEPARAETEAYVVLARQPDGRWLVVADAPDVPEADH